MRWIDRARAALHGHSASGECLSTRRTIVMLSGRGTQAVMRTPESHNLRAPRAHVAIVQRSVVRPLLEGSKRIESRFSQSRRPPFGCVSPGDVVHFKLSGGGLIGTASVTHVREFACLQPTLVWRLWQRYRGAIQAPASYWRRRLACRYGLLIWITPLGPPPRVSVPRQFGSGWVVLGAR